jgi:hypothetical protein
MPICSQKCAYRRPQKIVPMCKRSYIFVFCVRISVQFVVGFAAKDVLRHKFFFAEMCRQTIVMGLRLQIGSLYGLDANHA